MKKLSEQLSHGRLKSIYIPTEEEELLRLSIRPRGLIVKNRAQVTCQIKSKLYQFGYDKTLSDDKAATIEWVARIQLANHYPNELKEVLDYLCQDWLRLTNDLKELNKK